MPSDAGQWVAPGLLPEWTVRRVPITASPDDSRDGLDDLDDAALVAAARDGRRAAFDILVERHQRSVYHLCHRFVNNHDDAADLAQDVFLRAFRALGGFRGDAAVSTWLYRIGVNLCLNHRAARRAEALPLDAVAEPQATGVDAATALIDGERSADVRAAVAQLPDRQRATLVLRVYQGKSHKEIAEILGTTEGAAKANLFHALTSLRKRLGARTT
jgi:RNA polymerase sigma-70 factor (ECF subfamily)